MNCLECQNQIFDGELDRNAVAHLTGCDDCHALDREVRLNSVALAELREEVIPVRINRRPRWPWAVAIAAAAAIIAVIAWPNPPIPAPAAPLAKIEPLPVAPAMPEIAVAKVVPAAPRRPHSVHAKPVPVPAEPPTEQLMVKFFTDDPDIVIYWLIDPPKGEIGL